MASSSPLKGGGRNTAWMVYRVRKKITWILKPITTVSISSSKIRPIPKLLSSRTGHEVAVHHESSIQDTTATSPSLRLDSLVQSSEPYPILRDLVESVISLRSLIVDHPNTEENQTMLDCSLEILEEVAEAIPDPSRLSSELCTQLSVITRLFYEIGNAISTSQTSVSPFTVDPQNLQKQLCALHSEIVGSRCKSTTSIPSSAQQTTLRVRSWPGTLIDGSSTLLQVVAQASDVLPPLKSTSAGVLACWDVGKRVKSLKMKAQQLQDEMTWLLDNTPSDPSLSDECLSLRVQVSQLTAINTQSFFKRLRHLNRNEETLIKCKDDMDRIYRKMLLLSTMAPRSPTKKKRHRQLQTRLQKPSYISLSVTMAFFKVPPQYDMIWCFILERPVLVSSPMGLDVEFFV